jgi:glycosidase
LRGDIFDAVMNYRWYRAVRHFFNESPNAISAIELIDSMESFRSEIRDVNNYAMMNYSGGYDTPRILTSLFNKNKYKYYCKVHENPEYKIHKPDPATYQTLKLLLVQQYTYMGSPHIYAGDEMGMWGADDPSSRKPLIWPDYSFEDERAHPLGKLRPADKVEFNDDVFRYHQKLIRIRKENPVLISGEIEFIKVDHSEELLAYRRFDEGNELIVVFNHKYAPEKVHIPRKFKVEYKDILHAIAMEYHGDKMITEIPARTACLLKPVD